jgi:hypothetical protein
VTGPAVFALAAAARRAISPDNEQARTWLEKELAGPAYQQGRLLALLDRLWDWLHRVRPEEQTPLPVLAGAGVAALLVVVTLLALRHVRREGRPRRDVPEVLGSGGLSAADLRERAAAAMREGRYAEAVLDGMRAIAQNAAERTVLEGSPSQTAHEIAERLAAAFPDHAGELAAAATLFDAVAYGDRPAGDDDARQVLELHDALDRARPRLRRSGAAVGAAAGTGWQ